MIKEPVFVNSIKEILKVNKAILAAYVFGSEVRGTANKYSDIDIAVLFDAKIEENSYTDRQIAIMNRLSKALDKEVDVVVLNRAALFLKYHILKEGLKLYERPDRKEHTFEAMAILQYLDFLPMKNRMEYAMLNSIKARKNGKPKYRKG